MDFSKNLKNIRKNINLTQVQAAELSYMSRRKLIDIENGKISPSIEDIISLSKVYKKDLIDLFLRYEKYNNLNIEDLINNIEFKLSDMEYDSLLQDLINLKDYVECNTYIEQYYLSVMGFYRMKSSHLDVDTALKYLIQASKINNSDFSIKKYDTFTYSNLELRVLISIADCLRYRGDFNYYFEVCNFCYNNLSNINTSYFVISLHYATIKSMQEKYKESIEITNQCIETSNKYQQYMYLPFFYYMNYLNYMKINRPKDAQVFLEKAIFLCDCYNKNNLKNLIIQKSGYSS